MTEIWITALAIPIAIIITYFVYKYNLIGIEKGKIGTRQPDSPFEKSIFKRLRGEI